MNAIVSEERVSKGSGYYALPQAGMVLSRKTQAMLDKLTQRGIGLMRNSICGSSEEKKKVLTESIEETKRDWNEFLMDWAESLNGCAGSWTSEESDSLWHRPIKGCSSDIVSMMGAILEDSHGALTRLSMSWLDGLKAVTEAQQSRKPNEALIVGLDVSKRLLDEWSSIVAGWNRNRLEMLDGIVKKAHPASASNEGEGSEEKGGKAKARKMDA